MTSIREIDVENDEELVNYQVNLIQRLQDGIHEVIMDETGVGGDSGFLAPFASPGDYDLIAIAVAITAEIDDLPGLRERVEDMLKEREQRNERGEHHT